MWVPVVTQFCSCVCFIKKPSFRWFKTHPTVNEPFQLLCITDNKLHEAVSDMTGNYKVENFCFRCKTENCYAWHSWKINLSRFIQIGVFLGSGLLPINPNLICLSPATLILHWIFTAWAGLCASSSLALW